MYLFICTSHNHQHRLCDLNNQTHRRQQLHTCMCHDSVPSSTHASLKPQLCVHSTNSGIYRHMNVHLETSAPAQTLAPMHCYAYLHLTYSNAPSVHVYATQEQTHTNGHVYRHMCTGTLACIQACTHTFLLRSTQTHPEVSLHHVGPQNSCPFPPTRCCSPCRWLQAATSCAQTAQAAPATEPG